MVSLTITLLILGGLGYLGWNAFQQKQAGRGGPGARPDLPVPVLAATPRIAGRAGLSRRASARSAR